MLNYSGAAIKPKTDGGENLSGVNYSDQFCRTKAEWRKFLSGEPILDANLVPTDILQAWRRCRDAGLDPRGGTARHVLTGKDLQGLLNENKYFIDTSVPFMRHLYSFMAGSHFLVSLFDRRGYLMETMLCDEFTGLMKDENWIIGALWDEESAGNNAVGTVVAMRKPIQIFGPQHYLKRFHIETSSSAPIFDPEGKFLGGITMVGCYYLANPHTLGMTVAAARAIENELKIKKVLAENKAAFAACETAYSYQKAVISSIPEALISIDKNGYISLMNDNARKIFLLDSNHAEGRHIAAVLGKKNRHLLDIIERKENVTDAEVRIFSKGKGNDYTLTCHCIFGAQKTIAGKVLILNEIKRAKKLVTKMIGAKANFHFEDICGNNLLFLKALAQAKTVSRSSSNVLLLGESGTGKDIFAQAIHNASERRRNPYVAINCSAIPRDLIVSELFGYAEGAFTGSRRGGNQGKFELADGGTIFLDEIAETPLELQSALLRVIEDKCVIRLGGTEVRPVNVRIIVATNKDLLAEVHKGSFRKDLYYRINVFSIHLPSLSERPDDIPLLVDCFVGKYGKTLGKKIDRVDRRVIDEFKRFSWPGNVRELQNVIERMMNMACKEELTVELIPPEILSVSKDASVSEEVNSPRDFERHLISRMIRMNLPKSEIARKLEMTRSTLYRKMVKYNIT